MGQYVGAWTSIGVCKEDGNVVEAYHPPVSMTVSFVHATKW